MIEGGLPNEGTFEANEDSYAGQRVVILPGSVISRCRRLPVVQNYFVSDIGGFPTAPKHRIVRRGGCPQAIMIYCLRGAGHLELSESAHTVGPGNLCVIPPLQPHAYFADDADPWSILWVHIAGNEVAELIRWLGASLDNPLLYIPDAECVKSSFEDIYSCLKYNYSDDGLMSMTTKLLCFVSTLRMNRGCPNWQKQSAETRVRETRNFMEKHIDVPLKLGELAAQANQSVSYFSKLFKEQTGQAPMDYFLQMRVSKACGLLNHSEATVAEIAERVGYGDPYYFSRLFKKIQGVSPSAYRRSLKG